MLSLELLYTIQEAKKDFLKRKGRDVRSKTKYNWSRSFFKIEKSIFSLVKISSEKVNTKKKKKENKNRKTTTTKK